jgi:hypothetical protein
MRNKRFTKGKEDSFGEAALFGEGILLLMGCSKKLYNVLGGYEFYYTDIR